MLRYKGQARQRRQRAVKRHRRENRNKRRRKRTDSIMLFYAIAVLTPSLVG